MPQSLSRIHIHIVFSTKDRQCFIDDQVRQPLHAYLATVARDQGCNAYRVGGTHDHVHMVCALSRTTAVSKLVEQTKTASSSWMKKHDERFHHFYWQRGYGAFSLSPDHLQPVINYVERQEAHHRKESFQDELRRFCKVYGVEYDEKYMWD